MNNFTEGFWSLFIILGTLGGIAACYALLRWTERGAAPPGTEAGSTGHVWDEDLQELNNPLPRWWLIMFYLTMAFGVLYLVLYPGLGSGTGFLSWSSWGEYEAEMQAADERYAPIFEGFAQTPVEELAADPAAQKVGARLYAAYCTGCHGSDARGGPGFPNLRDDSWQWGSSGDAVKTSILAGRMAAMPGWLAPLGGEAGVHNMVAYVRSLSGLPHDAERARAGQSGWAMCAACHGAEGKGNPALGAPDLSDDVWLYGSDEEALYQSIANGRAGQMPAQAGLLSEAKVHVLAAYVWGLGRTD